MIQVAKLIKCKAIFLPMDQLMRFCISLAIILKQLAESVMNGSKYSTIETHRRKSLKMQYPRNESCYERQIRTTEV